MIPSSQRHPVIPRSISLFMTKSEVSCVPSLQYNSSKEGHLGYPPAGHPKSVITLTSLLPLHLHYMGIERMNGKWT